MEDLYFSNFLINRYNNSEQFILTTTSSSPESDLRSTGVSLATNEVDLDVSASASPQNPLMHTNVCDFDPVDEADAVEIYYKEGGGKKRTAKINIKKRQLLNDTSNSNTSIASLTLEKLSSVGDEREFYVNVNAKLTGGISVVSTQLIDYGSDKMMLMTYQQDSGQGNTAAFEVNFDFSEGQNLYFGFQEPDGDPVEQGFIYLD